VQNEVLSDLCKVTKRDRDRERDSEKLDMDQVKRARQHRMELSRYMNPMITATVSPDYLFKCNGERMLSFKLAGEAYVVGGPFGDRLRLDSLLMIASGFVWCTVRCWTYRDRRLSLMGKEHTSCCLQGTWHAQAIG
jgi:hypothetical protein